MFAQLVKAAQLGSFDNSSSLNMFRDDEAIMSDKEPDEVLALNLAAACTLLEASFSNVQKVSPDTITADRGKNEGPFIPIEAERLLLSDNSLSNGALIFNRILQKAAEKNLQIRDSSVYSVLKTAFARAAVSREYKKKAVQICGKRGRFMAEIMDLPKEFFSPDKDGSNLSSMTENDWKLCKNKDRKDIITKLMAEDPAKACSFVISDFKYNNAELRLELLHLIRKSHFCPESFLEETAKSDRSINCKAAAVSALEYRPGSKRHLMAEQALRSHLHFDGKKKKWTVSELSEEEKADFKAAGFRTESHNHTSESNSDFILRTCLNLMPFSFFDEITGCSGKETAEILFNKSPFVNFSPAVMLRERLIENPEGEEGCRADWVQVALKHKKLGPYDIFEHLSTEDAELIDPALLTDKSHTDMQKLFFCKHLLTNSKNNGSFGPKVSNFIINILYNFDDSMWFEEAERNRLVMCINYEFIQKLKERTAALEEKEEALNKEREEAPTMNAMHNVNRDIYRIRSMLSELKKIVECAEDKKHVDSLFEQVKTNS